MADAKDYLIGEMALHHLLLKPAQLEIAIQQQIDERFVRPLGGILIELGFLAPGSLEALLEKQRMEIEEFERKAPFGSLFGKSAVAKGFVTKEQLTQAMRAQARKHARGVPCKLGQVMLEQRLLSIQQFWDILHEQGDLRCGACNEVIDKPWFRDTTVLCSNCRSPAFSITPESAGPKVTRRKKIK